MVEGAALEMLCPERDLGFESLTLRQKPTSFNLSVFLSEPSGLGISSRIGVCSVNEKSCIYKNPVLVSERDFYLLHNYSLFIKRSF